MAHKKCRAHNFVLQICRLCAFFIQNERCTNTQRNEHVNHFARAGQQNLQTIEESDHEMEGKISHTVASISRIR